MPVRPGNIAAAAIIDADSLQPFDGFAPKLRGDFAGDWSPKDKGTCEEGKTQRTAESEMFPRSPLCSARLKAAFCRGSHDQSLR